MTNEPIHEVTLEFIWATIRKRAEQVAVKEPMLKGLIDKSILQHKDIAHSVAAIISGKLCSPKVSQLELEALIYDAYVAAPDIEEKLRMDCAAFLDFDPAAHDFMVPFLFFKGFHALQCYRAMNYLWHNDHKYSALFLQSRMNEIFGVDIHPGATIGKGIMIDHATGIVIGETAIVEDHVLFWHNVTLGGKGLEGGDRHPKVREGALVGTGSIILGTIEVGAGAKVGAGSVVTQNVPANTTVVGETAKEKSKLWSW